MQINVARAAGRESPSWPLVSLLLLSTVFPLFPKTFGNSPVHLVPLNIVLILLIIWLYGSLSKAKLLAMNVWWFFGAQFALLVVALMIDAVTLGASVGDLAGVLKPAYLFLFAAAGASLSMRPERVKASAGAYFALIVVFGIALGTAELLSASGDSWIYDLYKREERYILRGKTTTWFGVSYYHGYFYLLATVFFYQKLRSDGFRFGDVTLLIGSSALVLTAQSRTVVATMIVLLLVSIFSIVFGRSLRALFVALGATVAVCVLVVSSLPFLASHFWYLRVALEAIGGEAFYSFLSQGSIGVRMRQIADAVGESYLIVGAGLGRHGIPLESIYASYFYRFGFVSGLIFIVCYTGIGAFLYLTADLRDYLTRALGVIWLVSPLALFSSPMHEFPKIAVILFFFSGYTLSRAIEIARMRTRSHE